MPKNKHFVEAQKKKYPEGKSVERRIGFKKIRFKTLYQ